MDKLTNSSVLQGTTCHPEDNNYDMRMQKLMMEIMAVVQRNPDLNEVHEVFRHIMYEFNGSRVYIVEYDWELSEQNCTFEAVADGVKSQMYEVKHISLDSTPWFTQRLCARKPVMINDMDLLPFEARLERSIMSSQGVNSFIILPIISGDTIVGHWGIDTVEDNYRHWSQEDFHWLSAFSHILSIYRANHKEIFKKQSVKKKWELTRNRLTSIYNNIPVGIEIYDKDGFLIDSNDRDAEIFGMADKQDFIGSNLFDNPILPDHLLECLRNHKDINLHLDYDFKKVGKYYSTHIKDVVKNLNVKGKCIFNAQGEFDYYLFVISDNTETERAYAKVQDFQNLFSVVACYSKVGYAKFNIDTKQGFVAGEWYRNLGEEEGTPLEEIIGVYQHIHEDDRGFLRDLYQKVLRGEEKSYSGDIRVICPDGKIRWLHKNMIVIERKNGTRELTEINFDITYTKETEQSLMEAKEKAEEANKLKSAFLANMSHEIRTPLNAIVGFSNVLAETEDENEKKEYYHIIENSNTLLLQLINDILDLSKIEAGTLEFNFSDVDMNQIMKEVECTSRMRLQNEDVSIIFEGGLPECVLHTDKNRVTQVFVNFVNNAMKFTSKGTIRLGSYLKDDDTICFYVSDTGTGIAEEKLKLIFDRFVKLDSQAQGTGLGLTICSTIIDRLGGQIGVDSKQGEGSTFWFTLPYMPVKKSEMVSASLSDTLSVKEIVGKDKLTVLVAEDNASNYRLYESILKKDYKLIHAWNGIEAVELYKKHHPHIILMDIKMPLMDGYEATKRIRELSASVPIIAVTAYAYGSDEIRIMNGGFDGYTAKPVHVKSLKGKILDLLKTRLMII